FRNGILCRWPHSSQCPCRLATNRGGFVVQGFGQFGNRIFGSWPEQTKAGDGPNPVRTRLARQHFQQGRNCLSGVLSDFAKSVGCPPSYLRVTVLEGRTQDRNGFFPLGCNLAQGRSGLLSGFHIWVGKGVHPITGWPTRVETFSRQPSSHDVTKWGDDSGEKK